MIGREFCAMGEKGNREFGKEEIGRRNDQWCHVQWRGPVKYILKAVH